MVVALAFPADPDLATVQEYAARERDAALAVAPLVLRLYQREGPAGSEKGAFRRLAELVGLSAAAAMRLVHLAIALQKFAPLEDLVRTGRVPVDSAATLGEAVSEPGLVRPEEPWLEWAQTTSSWELRRLFLRRRDVARSGGSVYT